MTDRDWFTRGFGHAASDVRRALIEEGWFGRPDPRQPGGPDQGPADKLHPDKEGEHGFLGWLQPDQGRDQEKRDPDHGIDR
jgi:hypothetical protein